MSRDAVAACKLLKDATAPTLVIHERPDGDAIGSAAAIYKVFSSQKPIKIVCATAAAPIFEKVTGKLPILRKLPTDTDLIVLLDCAEWHRTGLGNELRALRRAGTRIISFDHHANWRLARQVDAAVYDPRASSTAEILYHCLQELRLPIDSSVASCLLMGIYTDTNAFRHSNTTSLTLRIASRLVSCGADLEKLRHIFDAPRSLVRTKLWGTVFSGVFINRFGVAVARIDAEALKSAGATVEDLAGIANHIALLSEARAALVMVETDQGWRVTLRTQHPGVDLRRLARYFGGRGTQKASGFLATNELISGKIS